MKKLLMLAVLGVILAASGCGTTIPPGKVGIVINQYGQNRGVSDYTTSTGRVWYNPITTSVVEYPTYVQTIKWTANPHEGGLNDNHEESLPDNESITFTTKESVSVNADVSLSFQLGADYIPAFYVKFRSDDLKLFAYGYLHNVTRDAMMEVGGHYTVENIMGDNEKFLHEVRDRIQSQMQPIGVMLLQFGFIGSPRPPQAVIESINLAQQAKYLALQKENELAQSKAEAAKSVAFATGEANAAIARAEGQARANTLLSNSLSDKVLERIRLDNQTKWIDKWSGVVPSTMIGGDKNGLLLNVPTTRPN